MAWGIAAAAGASALGGILGNAAASKDRKAAKQAMKKAIKELEAIGTPPDTAKALILQEFERQGVYSPELEQDLSDTFAESEMGKLTEDASLRDVQKSVLSELQNRARVGLSAEDRAALNKVRNEVQRDAQANRASVLSQMAARQMGGSGAELVSQLMAGQQAAELASQQSDNVMAQAQQRALQALSESANQASNIRSQDLNVNTARAQALDERNRFLMQNSIDRQARNVGNLNEAQKANLAEQQRIADANAQMANQEKQRQAAAKSSDFQNKLSLASAKAGAYTGQQQYHGQQAQNTAQQYANIGSGVAGGINAYMSQQNKEADRDLEYAKIAAGLAKK